MLFAILTDGEENASQEYSPEKVQTMVKAQQECGWPFLYLAATSAAVEAGLNLNIDRGTSFQYKSSAVGTQAAYGVMSNVSSALRRSRGLSSQSVIRGMAADIKASLDAEDVEPAVVETERIRKAP